MKTPFSLECKRFTDIASDYAVNNIYPKFFDTDKSLLSFEDCTQDDSINKIMDSEFSIDKIVRVSVLNKSLKYPIGFTFQERFREMKYRNFMDVTLTEFSHVSNLPSELYKIKAFYFLYGYYDIENNECDYIIFKVCDLLKGIVSNTLNFTVNRNTRSNQDFVCIKFKDIRNARIPIKTNMDF